MAEENGSVSNVAVQITAKVDQSSFDKADAFVLAVARKTEDGIRDSISKAFDFGSFTNKVQELASKFRENLSKGLNFTHGIDQFDLFEAKMEEAGQTAKQALDAGNVRLFFRELESGFKLQAQYTAKAKKDIDAINGALGKEVALQSEYERLEASANAHRENKDFDDALNTYKALQDEAEQYNAFQERQEQKASDLAEREAEARRREEEKLYAWQEQQEEKQLAQIEKRQNEQLAKEQEYQRLVAETGSYRDNKDFEEAWNSYKAKEDALKKEAELEERAQEKAIARAEKEVEARRREEERLYEWQEIQEEKESERAERAYNKKLEVQQRAYEKQRELQLKAQAEEDKRAGSTALQMQYLASVERETARMFSSAPKLELKTNLGKIKTDVDGVEKSATKLGTVVPSFFDRWSSKKGTFSKEADEIRAKISDIKAEMSHMSMKSDGEEVASKEWVETEKEIERTKRALNGYVNTANKLATIGVSYDSDSWKRVQYNIDATKTKLSELYEKQQFLIDTGQAKTTTYNNAGEYAKLSAELDKYQNKLAQVSSKGVSYSQVVGSAISRFVADGLKTVESVAKRVFSSIKSLVKSAVSTIWSTVKGVFSKITSGIKSLFNHFKQTKGHTSSLTEAAKTFFNKFNSYWSMFRTRIRRALVAEVFNDFKANLSSMAHSSNEFNDAMSRMIVSLRVLGAQITAILQPIINFLQPAISFVADTLTKVADKIAQFSARVTGQDWYFKASKGQYNYAKSLDETANKTSKANKATKEYKNTVLSFDQLHKLNGVDDTTKDASNITGVDGTTLEKAKTQATALNEIADKIYEAFKKHDYETAGKSMAEAVNYAFGWLGDVAGWEANGEKITGFLGNVTTTVRGFVEGLKGKEIGHNIADVFNTIIHSFAILTDPENGLPFKEAGLKIGEILAQAFADTDWNTAGSAIQNGIQGVVKFITGVISAEDFGKNLGIAFREAFTGFKDSFDPDTWSDFVVAIVESLADFLNEAFADPDEFSEFGVKVSTAINKAFERIGEEDENGNSIAKRLKKGITNAMQSIGNMAQSFLSELNTEQIGGILGDLLFSTDGITTRLLNDITRVGEALGKGLLDGIKPMADILGDTLRKTIEDNLTKPLMKNSLHSNVKYRAVDSDFIDAFVDQDYKAMRASLFKNGDKHTFTQEFQRDVMSQRGYSDNILDKTWANVWKDMDESELKQFIEMLRSSDNYGSGFEEWELSQIYQAVMGNFEAFYALVDANEGKADGLALEIVRLKEAQMAENDVMEDTVETFDDLADTVDANKPKINNTLSNLGDAFNNFMQTVGDAQKSENKWKITGMNVITGIINGINSKSGNLFSTLSNIASSMVSVLQGKLDENSPSKVMAREVGQYIPSGIAMGIDMNADVLVDSVEDLGDMTIGTAQGTSFTSEDSNFAMSLVSGMRQAVFDAAMMRSNDNGDSGDIVLVVDSEELARASMRGQRRIDKRTNPTVSFA